MSIVTAEQKQQFKEEGYFILESAIPEQHIELLRGECQAFIDKANDKMDAEGVNEIINKGLQELILGDTTAEEIAQKYETWVAANDSNRL